LAAAGIDLIDRVIAHALTCGETTGPVDPPAGTDADGDRFTADVDCDGSDLATPPPPGTRAVYVVGSLRSPAGDLAMLDRLLDAGLAVTLVDDNTLGDGLDLDGVAVIVLGSSVKPFVVRDQLAEVTVPLITFEPYVHDDNLLATRPRETSTTFTNIVVSSVEHAITAGVSAGSVAVYTDASKLSYGTASAAATVLGRPDRAVIFTYNPGDLLINGTPAPSSHEPLHGLHGRPTPHGHRADHHRQHDQKRAGLTHLRPMS